MTGPALATKPQAVRQVAADLIPEFGPPYDRLWRILVETHGEREGAPTLAKVLAALVRHGEQPVRVALEEALAGDRLNLLPLARIGERPEILEVAMPASLAGQVVERPRLAEYDQLLTQEAAT